MFKSILYRDLKVYYNVIDRFIISGSGRIYIYLNPINFHAFNFRAVKQFIYLRKNNFCALAKFTFSHRSKLWLLMFTKTLREIYQNAGFLWSVFSRIWTESYPYFPIFSQNRKFSPNTGKYGYDSGNIR